jgi:hypothetical protein
MASVVEYSWIWNWILETEVDNMHQRYYETRCRAYTAATLPRFVEKREATACADEAYSPYRLL